MSLDADHLIDRRRLKRRLTLWRLIAVAAAVVAVLAIAGRAGDLAQGDYVARFDVDGIIFDDRARDETLKELAENDAVKAVVVRIDSPGGTVVGGEALYRGLRAIAEKKPVVAVIGEMGTSAAYMAAMATEYVIARSGSVTGSIGVLM